MAGKLYISLKILSLFAYNGSFTLLANAMVADQEKPSPVVFYIFIFMMFVPEIAIISSKGFRQWMKQGIEDADGQLHKEDVKDLRVHYAALWMLRVFVLFGLLMIFYQIQIPWSFYMLPFFGAMGLEGVALARNIYANK